MSYKLQQSFAAGEITPLMHLRSEDDVHKEGLGLSRNMIPTPQGPAVSRRGFEFIVELENETFCRVFDIDISFGESYVVAVTENFIYVLDRNGFTRGVNLVSNSQFSSGSTDWVNNNTQFIGGTAVLDPTPGQPANISQGLVTADGALEHIIELKGSNIESGHNAVNILIGTSPGGSEIVSFSTIGKDVSEVFIPGVENFWITMEVDPAGNTKTLDAVNCFPTVDAGELVTFPSPYTNSDIVELQVDKEPGNKTIFFFVRTVEPYELIFDGTHIWTWQLVTFEFGVDEALDPLPPVWGTNQNPGCVTFYAGRMAVGGTLETPIGIWLSKPRDYRNFDQGDPDAQISDDSLFLPLDKHGELVWLKGNKQLFAGLDSGEHVIYGDQGIISSTNASTEQHSTYGSSRIQPQVVNEEIAYVDTRGRKVRLIDYDSNKRNMTSFDISFIAEHITASRISGMDHGSSPFGVIASSTFIGDIVTCHIEKDRGTYGWGKFTLLNGFVQSLTFVREFGVDIPWISVLRNDKLYIERIDFNVKVFMDSYITIVENVLTNIFFGFDHLIGELVQVVLDGALHPDQVVAENGSIATQLEGFVCSAGFGYTAEIETLPQMDETEEGSTRSHIKRFSKVSVALLDCPRPIVNGQDTYRRNPATPMDTREESKTEVVEITNTGWSDESIINVSQPLALDLVVAGVGGKLKIGKL